jgi:hypothetical protein
MNRRHNPPDDFLKHLLGQHFLLSFHRPFPRFGKNQPFFSRSDLPHPERLASPADAHLPQKLP